MTKILGNKSVDDFVTLNCVKIATDDTGWDSLFFNKKAQQYWVKTYPNSELHGGGQPELELISEKTAKELFGV